MDFPQRKAVGGVAQNILVKAGPWTTTVEKIASATGWESSGANAEDRESKKLGLLEMEIRGLRSKIPSGHVSFQENYFKARVLFPEDGGIPAQKSLNI